MKKLLQSTTLAILLLVALQGCKGGSGDPKSVAIAFMDAMKAKDFEAAEKYATKDSKSALEMMKSAMKMAEAFGGKSEEMNIDKDWKGKKVAYGDPKIEGDNATVSLMVDGKEEMPISLKKEDGSWKVAFDKNTLMKTDKMKENTNESMENIDSSLQNMKGLGDSISNALKDASKAMDTANKELENN